MEKHFTYSKSEYLKAMRGAVVSSGLLPIAAMILLPLFSIAEIAYVLIKGWNPLNTILGAVIVILWMLVIFLLGVYPTMCYKQAGASGAKTLRLTKHSMIISEGEKSAEYENAAFIKIDSDSSFIYFHMKNHDFVTLPKRIFDENELSILSENYKCKKILKNCKKL